MSSPSQQNFSSSNHTLDFALPVISFPPKFQLYVHLMNLQYICATISKPTNHQHSSPIHNPSSFHCPTTILYLLFTPSQFRLQDQSLIALQTLILFGFLSLSLFGGPYFLTYPTCALKVWNVDWGKT